MGSHRAALERCGLTEYKMNRDSIEEIGKEDNYVTGVNLNKKFTAKDRKKYLKSALRPQANQF